MTVLRIALSLLGRVGIGLKPMVFCFHSVRERKLIAQLRFLTSIFRTVRLEEIRAVGPNAIAFTLDDCRAVDVRLWDAMTKVFDIPATIFLSVSHHLGELPMWPDMLRQLVDSGDSFSIENRRFNASKRSKRETVFAAAILAAYASQLNTAELEHALGEELRAKGRKPASGRNVVGVNELSRLLANPRLSVGSHTMTHAFLAKIRSPEGLAYELDDSLAFIRARYPRSCSLWLCFPYGSSDLIGDAALEAARKRYVAAVVLNGRVAGDDPHLTGRIGLYEHDGRVRIILKIIRAQIA